MRHELHLARAGFPALARSPSPRRHRRCSSPAGRRAVRLIGVGLVAGNHAVAVAVDRAGPATLKPSVFAVGYSMFVVRMLCVLGMFGSLQSVAWIHGPCWLCRSAQRSSSSLTAECVSYARGSYVPAWRTTMNLAAASRFPRPGGHAPLQVQAVLPSRSGGSRCTSRSSRS